MFFLKKLQMALWEKGVKKAVCNYLKNIKTPKRDPFVQVKIFVKVFWKKNTVPQMNRHVAFQTKKCLKMKKKRTPWINFWLFAKFDGYLQGIEENKF